MGLSGETEAGGVGKATGGGDEMLVPLSHQKVINKF